MLYHLEVFAAVAREGTFTGAAQAQAMSQASVSDHVALLEQQLGQRLFERAPGRRQVALTGAGRALLAHVGAVFQALDAALEAVDAAAGTSLDPTEAGSVSIGAGQYFVSYVLPAVYATFRRQHPRVAVHAELVRGASLVERVAGGSLDLGIVAGAVQNPRVTCRLLDQHDVVIVAPPDHPLVGVSRVALAQLAAEPFVLPDATTLFRHILEQRAAEAGVTLTVGLETNSLAAQIQAVSRGLGLGILSAGTVAAEVGSGRLAILDVERFPVPVEWYVVRRRAPVRPVVRALERHLLSYAGRMADFRQLADAEEGRPHAPG